MFLVYRFINLSVWKIETGAYYGAPANAFDFQNADSVGDCCNLCKADGANCAAFSYITDQKMCYIYSAPLNSPEVQPNTIGGIPNWSYAFKINRLWNLIFQLWIKLYNCLILKQYNCDKFFGK